MQVLHTILDRFMINSFHVGQSGIRLARHQRSTPFLFFKHDVGIYELLTETKPADQRATIPFLHRRDSGAALQALNVLVSHKVRARFRQKACDIFRVHSLRWRRIAVKVEDVPACPRLVREAGFCRYPATPSTIDKPVSVKLLPLVHGCTCTGHGIKPSAAGLDSRQS
jgi:hypothetical protein